MRLYVQMPDEGPEVVYLRHWSIRQFENGKKFFVGYDRDARDGRVSTQIVQLDALTRRGRTASGRLYELVGPSGHDSDAEYVFNLVSEIIGDGCAWRDITKELIPDCRKRALKITGELTLEDAAQFLNVSCSYFEGLVEAGALPSRVDKDGHTRIPTSALHEYREKMRAEQIRGLQQLTDASERAGLYDAEIEDIPKRQSTEDEE